MPVAIQDGGNVIHRVELTGGDLHHEIVGGVVGEREPTSVDPVRRDEGGQGEPLVAIHQRYQALPTLGPFRRSVSGLLCAFER